MGEPANNTQTGGDHYKKKNITKDQVPEGALDVWDVVWLWKRDHFTATAIKYLARWEDKGGKEDLKKAIHWIQKRIEILESEEKTKPSGGQGEYHIPYKVYPDTIYSPFPRFHIPERK